NVHAYLKAQVAASERASYFSVVWNEVLRRHPELDYNVQFPATQYARHIYLDSEKEQLDLLMKQFSKQYGFILFIKGNCKFCHAMAPIVERVAKEYGIYVTYRSLDGGFVANLSNQVKDNGLADRMQITQVPALVAVEPNRDQWFPIVFGAVSEIELKEQIQAHLEYLVAKAAKDQTTIARLNPGEPNAQIDLAN
ncbi:MAG: conjugal transfer protein TraF, partial [Gammaproteobacteria bacterium]